MLTKYDKRFISDEEATMLLDAHVTESHEIPFSDFIERVRSVYVGRGLSKGYLRTTTILEYRAAHRESIRKAIDSGRDIFLDVLRDYPDLRRYQLETWIRRGRSLSDCVFIEFPYLIKMLGTKEQQAVKERITAFLW
jgi:hypothetical protein